MQEDVSRAVFRNLLKLEALLEACPWPKFKDNEEINMYQEREFGGRSRFGGGFSNDRQMTPPVKEGEEIDVTIEAVGEKGDGIAKKDGFVLFVPNTKEGDTVKIKITKVLRRVGFAEVVGEGSAPAEGSEEAPADEPEAEPEDSEDFGEEEKE